jgi:membrane protein YdbS with pleckstrin-like domain
VVVKEFGADSQLITLYQTYLSIIVLAGFLSWIIPVTIGLAVIGEALAAIVTVISCLVPLLVATAIALYWIPLFQKSIRYVLEGDELIVIKGVWWKTKSVVPYNRITNVNIYQGPISRHFGLGRLSIQTAGFSGASSSGYKTAEAEIVGVKDFEETKDTIMNFVKGIEPVAVEAKTEPLKNINQEMLQELRRIRKAVER